MADPVCADTSRLMLSDGVTDRCPHCGHPLCWPGRPCVFCQFEVRLRKLEVPNA